MNVETLENRLLLTTLAFAPQQTFAVGNFPTTVVAADLNGDGHQDLVVLDHYGEDISILLGNGNGTFQPQQSFYGGPHPTALSLADVNGDGKSDILVANYGAGPNSGVSVFLGNGNGTFQPQRSFTAAPYSSSLAVADVNGDGHPDLLVTDLESSKLSVLLGNGDGTFETALESTPHYQPSSIAVADLNGDGHPDIVITNNAGAGYATLLLGNGNGTFTAPQTLAVGIDPVSVSIADVNGDGKSDLIFFNDLGSYGGVTILLGNGNGTFAAQQSILAGAGAQSLNVTDVNGDGIPDLLVTNGNVQYPFSAGLVSILVGNGNGTFQAPQAFPAGYNPHLAITADLTGDGQQDLIVTDSGHDNVSILLSQFAVLDNGVLQITGTSGADSISVTDNAGSVLATRNGITEGPFTPVTSITIGGGGGNDTISVAGIPIPATIGGAGGDDCVIGGGGNDSLKGGAGNDTIGGAGGDDTVVGGGSDDSLKGGAGNDFVAGGPGNDTLHGGVGNDSLLGGAGDDVVNGNVGDDTIVAGSGSSQLFAATGNDSIIGSTTAGDQPDSIYCGGSTDTILAGSDDQIFNSVLGDSISGGMIVS